MPDAPNSRTPEGRREAMRVLFLVGRLAPTAACRSIVALACELNRAGCRVEMICRSGSLRTIYPRHGAPRTTEHDPPIWLSRALGRNLRAWLNLGGLARRVREMAPDLVHVHGARLSGVGARLARRVRTPYVLSIGDFIDPGQSVSRSRRFLRRILCSSDAVRVDLVNRLGLPRDLIDVVPDGVCMEHHPPRALGLAEGKVPVVGAMGRLVESKGQEHFLRAAHLLAMRGRRVHFVVAGHGPDRKWLQNLVAELDLVDRVTFARGPVDQLDVLRAIDVLVAPALQESLGLPVIEAMAAGIPVIATSAGGIFSLIENGKTGILVPKKDPDAMARAIEGLIADPQKAVEMGRRGRERIAAQLRIEQTARRVRDVYERVLDDGVSEGSVAPS